MLLNQLGLISEMTQEIEKVQLSINNSIKSDTTGKKRTIEICRLLGKRDGLARALEIINDPE